MAKWETQSSSRANFSDAWCIVTLLGKTIGIPPTRSDFVYHSLCMNFQTTFMWGHMVVGALGPNKLLLGRFLTSALARWIEGVRFVSFLPFGDLLTHHISKVACVLMMCNKTGRLSAPLIDTLPLRSSGRMPARGFFSKIKYPNKTVFSAHLHKLAHRIPT